MKEKAYKPTVVFDFDGVIHSYASGWKGETVIPDPVVPGMKEVIHELRESGYKVVVVSTRCRSEDGTVAISQYLWDNDIYVDEILAEKPPAICYIDDRAICFDGNAEGLVEKVKNFHSWAEGKKVADELKNPDTRSGLRPCRVMIRTVERDENGEAVQGESFSIDAFFHAWTTDYEELRDGVGQYPAAIVEMLSGGIITVPASDVAFTDVPVVYMKC